VTTLGITSGASTPEVLVIELIEHLSDYFEVSVEEVAIATEAFAKKITLGRDVPGKPMANAGLPSVRTMDIAKRLMDYGFHPPTVYFPLIVDEALMIEPTETETRETLDSFVSVMHQIAEETRTTPEIVRTAPHTTVVGRLDQALAARKPNLRWMPGQEITH